MNRVWPVLLISFLVLFLSPCSVSAIEVWDERFINNNLVNLTQSDAFVYINPAGGYATLPSRPASGAIRLREDTYDKVIMSSMGIEYFSFTGAEMVKNPFLSHPIEGSALALTGNNYSVWTATDREIRRLEFDGSGMIENPFLKITGKSNILSISSQPLSDELAVLVRDHTGGGRLDYYASTGSEMERILTFDLPVQFGNPVDIAVIPGTMDIVYATENAVLHFSFDGVGFVQNPFMSVTGLSNIRSLSAYDGGFAILRADRKEHYLFTGDNMAYVETLSLDLPASASLTLKPGSYDFAVIDRTGRTRYFRHNGTYTEDVTLSVQAAPLGGIYHTPRQYVSRTIQPIEIPLMFMLEVDADKPQGTDIKYYLEIGATRTEIVPGVILPLDTSGSGVILIAEMSTQGENAPKITRMRLSMIRAGINNIRMDKFPVHPDFEHLQKPFQIYPEFPVDFPANYLADQDTLLLPMPVQAGGVVAFELVALGNPDKVFINIEYRRGPLVHGNISLELSNIAGDRWVGSLNIPIDDPDGSEYDLAYVRLEGAFGVMELPASGYMHNPFIITSDHPDMNLLNFFRVHLTE